MDGDGVADASEPVIATEITDDNGQYLFAGLPLDDGIAVNGSGAAYVVVVTDADDQLVGLSPTYDGDGAGATPNSSAVILEAGGNQDDRLQDFGYVTDDSVNPADGALGSIGDTVWGDLNNNGAVYDG